ncbi:hypothetical protein NMY22_g15258 [Coprinellus aureogranulatus]|nr:hypothetical protein NMY22_g15258 [Coprinellus aureogranulatus]
MRSSTSFSPRAIDGLNKAGSDPGAIPEIDPNSDEQPSNPPAEEASPIPMHFEDHYRSLTPPLVDRIEREFDEPYLKSCKIIRFNPQRLKPSNLELVFRLGRVFGPGITRGEFRRIVRQCSSCRNLVFVDRQDCHRCDGPSLQTQAEGFDLMNALLSSAETSGLGHSDLPRLLTRCDACERICLGGTIDLHDCSVLGSIY